VSDAFYTFTRAICIGPWRAASRVTLIGREHTRRPGAFIIAANHLGPYDVAALIAHSIRRVDFVSIVEIFRNPVVASFFRSMNAFPLDRSRPDPTTTRTIITRLRAGRVIGMFPEGGFRPGDDSLLDGGPMRPGLGRLSLLTQAPVIPCAIVGTNGFGHWSSWLPARRVSYGVAFGPPMTPPASRDATSAFEATYRDRMVALGSSLREASRGALM